MKPDEIAIWTVAFSIAVFFMLLGMAMSAREQAADALEQCEVRYAEGYQQGLEDALAERE